ncbi:MAG: N-acetylglucosamine-6-phosphate deacetylase [Planctomycetes bacterium]|nr:N-acetylglucosamine-6-phosphate deacetylase [Planctomycetota bacterium]
MSLVLREARLDGRVVDLLLEDGRIAAIGPDLRVPADAETIAAAGDLVAPAFVDLQLNGAFGHDLIEEPESLWTIARRLPRHGVGAFLPTAISCDESRLQALIDVIARGPAADFVGARVLGLHLEGPCLAPARRGAHEEAWLRSPAAAPAALRHPLVRMVTLAPELPGAPELIAELTGRGIVVAAGHSMAGPAELAAARRAGLKTGTHLFNAMSGLHHREPGLAAALLDDDALHCGIIADGIHVDPLLLRLALRLKGPDRLYLVSDAMAGAGCAPGRHRLAGQEVLIDDRAVRLPDGRLAGSATLLDRGLAIMRAATGLEIDALLPLVTSTPAALLGEEIRLEAGARADLVLLSPSAEVRATILAGRLCHRG